MNKKRSGIWRIPPAALFLYIFMTCSAFAIGMCIGIWILPLAMAAGHGGWPEVCRIPISERLFADVPAFLSRESFLYTVVYYGRFVLGLAGAGTFGSLAQRRWEYLVIDKYEWMTREEVEAFYKRAGD